MTSRPSRTAGRRRRRPEPPRRPSRPWFWLLVALFIAIVVALLVTRPRPAVSERIGIVAGHMGYDSGAVCPDGLREVDITVPVAQRVAGLLEQQGYQVDILPEYGDRLRGYRGLVLVSLHVDSCLPEFSGFKIAGRSRDPLADESALLVDMLTRSYAAATGLGFHANTITPDMTQYHAFQEVDLYTPSAIVELGFLGGDRELLVAHQDRVARGIYEGIVAFLQARGERRLTPTMGR